MAVLGTPPAARGSGRAAVAAWAGLALAFLSRGYLTVILSLGLLATLPTAFGLSGSVISGNSMRPAIGAGDVVLTSPVPAAAPVPVGQVVAFTAVEGSAAQGRVLHRIIGRNPDGTLITAGDANAVPDSAPLRPGDIEGVAVILVRGAGLPLYWLRSQAFQPLLGWILVTALAVAVELVGAVPRRPHPGRSTLVPATTVLAVGLALLGTGEDRSASAAFTAREQSTGNRWAYPAASPATQLGFTTNPSNSTGGSAFPSQPVVTLLDSGGAPTTGDRERAITLTLTGGSGSLTCAQNPVTTSHGVASFTGCSVDKVGTYTLVATTSSLPSAPSASFRVTTGPAARLAFSAVPGTGTAGAPFASQPSVRILDAGGNLTASSATVALSLGQPGASLSCSQNPRAAVGGVVTFSGCSVDHAGTYTLTARSPSLPEVTSSSFVITTPLLTCTSTTWMAVFSWSPTPRVPTTYHLYVSGVRVPATGADGWNSSVQITNKNVPANKFPAGPAPVEVRRVLDTGAEQLVGIGTVVIGTPNSRTYLCG